MIITHNGTILTNDGVVLNNITTSSSFSNTYSLDFDGVDDKVDCGNGSDLQITGDISISCWFKTTDSLSVLVSKRNSATGFNSYGYQLYISGDKIYFLVTLPGNNPITGVPPNSYKIQYPTDVTDDEWHHVLGTIEQGVEISINVDNTGKISSAITVGTYVDSTTPLLLGYNQVGSGHHYFDGLMDEVSVFDVLITSSDVRSSNGKPINLTGLSNLVAWYRMGDNGLYKDPQWLIPSNENKDKVSNYSMNFDGVNDYVNSNYMATTSLYTSGFTISAWVNPDTLTNRSIVGQYSGGNRFYFRLYDAKYWVGFGSWNGGIGATAMDSTVQTGIWQNIILTYNPSDTTLRTYRNGIFEGSQFKDLSVLGVPTSPLNIGNSNNNGYFDGNMGDVAIFPRVVTPSEITTISTDPTDLTPLNPIAWWKMGEEATFSTNWTIPDEVGTSTGTSVNMTIEDRVGDAPDSSNNALSFNMDEINRVEDTPPTP